MKNAGVGNPSDEGFLCRVNYGTMLDPATAILARRYEKKLIHTIKSFRQYFRSIIVKQPNSHPKIRCLIRGAGKAYNLGAIVTFLQSSYGCAPKLACRPCDANDHILPF